MLLSQSHCVCPWAAEQGELLCWVHRRVLSWQKALGAGVISSDTNTWEYFWRGSVGTDMVQVLRTSKVSCVCTHIAEGMQE